jgi:hypothetical protein
MGQTNKSEEALDKIEIIDTSEEENNDSETEDADKSETTESEPAGEEGTEEKTEIPTVNLSDFTRTKDVLHRVATRILGDGELLAKLAEDDPKLLERVKAEFPKKFRDIVIPKKVITDEDIRARIATEVARQVGATRENQTLSDLRTELGISEMEFNDMKPELAERAAKYLELELADNSKEAYELALKNISGDKYKTLMEKRTLKSLNDKSKVTAKGSVSKGSTKKFSKIVLENYKKLGFKDPEEMVKYQQGGSAISMDDIVGKKKK